MKVTAILFSFIIAASALTDEEQWKSFKTRHGKTYKSLREEYQRFQIFKDNLRNIEEHNARSEAGEETYEMGVNQFTDLTQDEFVNNMKASKFEANSNHVSDDNDFDFRSAGDVTPVVDQRDCNSGYAFSVVAQLQSVLSIYKGEKVVLSAQEIIDCTQSYGNDGCNGGTTANAFKYIKETGISLDKDYPYMAVASSCRNLTSKKFPFTIFRMEKLPSVEEAVRQAVEASAPVSISLNSAPLNTYTGGILDPVGCNQTDLNHAVLLVGFGRQNGTDYWTFQNSWGKGFGENGYFRMVRNGKSTCGMLNEPYWTQIGP